MKTSIQTQAKTRTGKVIPVIANFDSYDISYTLENGEEVRVEYYSQQKRTCLFLSPKQAKAILGVDINVEAAISMDYNEKFQSELESKFRQANLGQEFQVKNYVSPGGYGVAKEIWIDGKKYGDAVTEALIKDTANEGTYVISEKKLKSNTTAKDWVEADKGDVEDDDFWS